MASDRDIEIQVLLSILLKNGRAEIKDSKPVFDQIESSFPIICNTIDWTKVNGFVFKTIEGSGSVRFDNIRKVLSDIVADFPRIKKERVIIIGDLAFECAYEMSFDDFLDHFKIFFEFPQHNYVLFPSTNKCLSLTFEGKLYFGPIN